MSIINQVQSKRFPRNNFNLSKEVLLSGRLGKLIPIQCEEVCEGDKFKQNVNFLIRFAPLSAPAMVRFNVHFHSFFVPYRIITPRSSASSTWEKFVECVGVTSSEYIPELPSIYSSEPVSSEYSGDNTPSFDFYKVGSLWDYLGLPTIKNNDTPAINIPYEHRINVMPFLAYQKIYDDWYRRDQIETPIAFPVNFGSVDISETDAIDEDKYYPEPDDDTPDMPMYTFLQSELFKLRTRNYERDYFTSALPEPQFGDDVMIGGDVVANVGAQIAFDSLTNVSLRGTFSNNTFDAAWQNITNVGPSLYQSYLGNQNTEPLRLDILSGDTGSAIITGNVDTINGITANPFSINQLRLAMQLQGVREKINRGGTRYIEILKSVFGVVSSDARLQRVQYLGGFKAPITVGTVVQQSATDADGKLGELAGKATAGGFNRLFKNKYIFEEKGLLFTIMSITPRTSYYGGTPKLFRKFDPIDYFVPDFDHLGEQEIYNYELFDSIEEQINSQLIHNLHDTFGYQPRYAELKIGRSSVHGEFRNSLDNWHVARSFDSIPGLNPSFIHADSDDFDRLFVFENVENTSNEHFYAQIVLDIVVKRNASKYSTPFTFY